MHATLPAARPADCTDWHTIISWHHSTHQHTKQPHTMPKPEHQHGPQKGGPTGLTRPPRLCARRCGGSWISVAHHDAHLAHLVYARAARQCPGRIMPPPLVRLLRDTEAAPRDAVAGVAKTASLSAASVPEAEARPATLNPILAALARPASSRPAGGAWAGISRRDARRRPRQWRRYGRRIRRFARVAPGAVTTLRVGLVVRKRARVRRAAA